MSNLLTTDSFSEILDKAEEQIKNTLKAKLGELENKALIESVTQKQKCLEEIDNMTIFQLDQLGIEYPEIESPRECEQIKNRHNILFTWLQDKINEKDELIQKQQQCLKKIDNLSIERLLEMEIPIEVNAPLICKDILERYNLCHNKQIEQHILNLGEAIEEKEQCQETIKQIETLISTEMEKLKLVIKPDLTQNIQTVIFWLNKRSEKPNERITEILLELEQEFQKEAQYRGIETNQSDDIAENTIQIFRQIKEQQDIELKESEERVEKRIQEGLRPPGTPAKYDQDWIELYNKLGVPLDWIPTNYKRSDGSDVIIELPKNINSSISRPTTPEELLIEIPEKRTRSNSL